MRDRFPLIKVVSVWAMLAILAGASMMARAADGDAAAALAQAGVAGGLVVHLGCGQGGQTAGLPAQGGFIVQGLDAKAENVAAARDLIRSKGLYGRISIDSWDGQALPYADNLVNALLIDEGVTVGDDEVRRALAPQGVALRREGGQWKAVSQKPRPATIDDWTHYFHSASGNPVANDTEVAPPTRLQWQAGPNWSRHHDHMASMTSLVSAGGRLFYILDTGQTESIWMPSRWDLYARDAFNGLLLWKRSIPKWNTQYWPLKSGPAHLTRRLVAEGDRVYTTLGIDDPVSLIDARTGEVRQVFKGTEFTGELILLDNMLLAVAGTGPAKEPEFRRESTYVWANSKRAGAEWAWEGDLRRVIACDATDGRVLWQIEKPVAPCSLAAQGGQAAYFDGQQVVCLDRSSGKELWRSEPMKGMSVFQTSTGPRLLFYKDVVLFAGNTGQMTALAGADGKTLWTGKSYPSGHNSLKDLIVMNDVVWTGDIAANSASGKFEGYDFKTGKVVKSFLPDNEADWFHHRCYPSKATVNYFMTSRNGVEFIDPAKESWDLNHWVRGGCIYGVLPSNGMMYAPMQSCGCFLESKMNGFSALIGGTVTNRPAPEAERLVKGPAFGQVNGPEAGPGDWPTYRRDIGRGGFADVAVPASLKVAWEAKWAGERISPATAAAGMLFVSSVDSQLVRALDLKTGAEKWVHAAAARVDSPPTYYNGLAIFGCADGSITALRAADGQLAWRHFVAPGVRDIVFKERVESAWPVSGAVLVREGVVYAMAGRSIFLDGGLRFVKLDAATGRLLGEATWNDKDPETGEDMHKYVVKEMLPVALADILSCDGKFLYMRSQKFDFDGKRLEIEVKDVTDQAEDGTHLFCQIGFLDDSWFHRGFWTYGRRVSGGYSGWQTAAHQVPAGRILAVDDAKVYGYGRKPAYYANSSVFEYHLFAADKLVDPARRDIVRRTNSEINARRTDKSASSSDWKARAYFSSDQLTAASYQWAMDQPSVIMRALVGAGDLLFVAGPPDLLDEREVYRRIDDPDIQKALAEQDAAYDGQRGGQLWAVNKADGKPVARYQLDTIPVFDGLIAVDGRLVMSTVDGRVICLAGDGGKALAAAPADAPLQTISDEPADPNYLLPPGSAPAATKKGTGKGASKGEGKAGAGPGANAILPTASHKDFVALAGVAITDTATGYRLKPAGDATSGLAVQQLPAPLKGKVTLRCSATLGAPGGGQLSNAYLAFGDGPRDNQMVKLVARMRLGEMSILQASLSKGIGDTTTEVKLEKDKPFEMIVTVDLKTQMVKATISGITVEEKLIRPLEAITHVGYGVVRSTTDYTKIEVKAE